MNSREPLISVILPVKNAQLDLLERAIASVHAQTYKNYEILLIDDGSREDFAGMLDALAENDDKLRLFHISPSGVSGARNFAVQKAKGDIITYLDGDDALSPFCFEEAVLVLADETIDAVWGGTEYVTEEKLNALLENPDESARTPEGLKTLLLKLTPKRIHRTRSECIARPYRFGENGYINRGIAARFLRKRLFENGGARFPEGYKLYEDAIWNLELMDRNICYVRSVWYYYFNNESSVSNRFNKNILKDIEVPVMTVRRMLDLSNDTEYRAYTRFLMDSLRYVYKCMYGNSHWNPDRETRKKYIDHIYNDRPWKEISSGRYIKAADKSDRIKAVLFKRRLLFLYWKLTWKKM